MMQVGGPPSVGFQQGPRPTQNGGAMMPMNTPPMATIPLNTMIDYIIQKTYHDIVVMAELLPVKSDMERKIDIAHFANRTRQLVIRLLAVVKWAGSVGKVIKCEEITQLLDQQAMLFVDTANKLHTLANQLVVQARLPNFAIPAAVDVLTTGTYPRLPRAIRDKIIPPDPITPIEKAATLKRLNQIIMYRLVTTKIPLQITELIVDKGMVKLIVPGEFQAMLTLMGDKDEISWRLLKLELMVEDKETGSGRALVHDMQINYIHELVQSRLVANENPLQDLYDVMHSFCLSLQLEVLQAQTVRLIQERWGRLVQIDEYQPGVKVVLSYWRLSPYISTPQEVMSVSVHQRQTEGALILNVTHKPPLILQNVKLVEKASKIKDLSFERLLSDTIRVRSFHKLYELKQILQKHVKKDASKISEDHTCLIVPLLQPCQSNENLCVSVDPQTGVFVPVLVGFLQQTLDEMEKSINESPANLLSWIPKFRNKLAKERCKSSVQNLPAICLDDLPLSNKNVHPVGNLSEDVVFVKLSNFHNFYIVVELIESEDNSTNVIYRYHLLSTTTGNTTQQSAIDIKADTLLKLEPSLCESDSESMVVDVTDENDVGSHFISELAQIVSTCNARIPFIELIHDLSKEGFLHQGVLEEGVNVGLCVKVIAFPDVPSNTLHPNLCKKLLSNLLDCSFKMLDKSSKNVEVYGTKSFNVELVFCDCPLRTESHFGNIMHVNIPFISSTESPVKLFKDEWTSIMKLYEPVMYFAQALEDENRIFHKITSVYSYNYRTLVLKYGNDRHLLVTIKWSSQNSRFVLHFGRCLSTGANSHTIAAHYLTNFFNSDPDIGKLVQVLHDTYQPLHSICSLASVPLIGMSSSIPGAVQQNAKIVSGTFTLLVQTITHMRLIFRASFCLDIHCLPNKKVALRDGSLSRFDATKVKGGMIPIPGLHTFLSLFESQGNSQRSVTEKDDPPIIDFKANEGLSAGDMRSINYGIWAGGYPTILDQDTFSLLLNSQTSPNQYSMSLLEQFFGCTLIRRELEQIVHSQALDSQYYIPSPNHVPNLPMNDPLTVFFAINSLMFRCTMQFTNNQPHLSLRVLVIPPQLAQERGIQLENWLPDELLALERFFKIRVATPPFRPANVQSFCYIISSKSIILKELVTIMRLELANHQKDMNIKCVPQLCLTVPPRSAFPSGVPAVYVKEKVVVFITFTMKSFNQSVPAANRNLTLPIVWIPSMNVSILQPQTNPLLQRADLLLRTWLERKTGTECHVYNAIKYLMDNFTLT